MAVADPPVAGGGAPTGASAGATPPGGGRSAGPLQTGGGYVPAAGSHAVLTPMPDLAQSLNERPPQHYARRAKTPVPFMAAALVVGIATIGVVRWSLESDPDGGSTGVSEGWWTAILSVFLGNENVGYADDVGRLWWALGAMGVASVLVILWVRRIGMNSRLDVGMFGAPLAIAAIPAWWMVPIVWGGNHGVPSLGELRTRITLALVIFVLQALLARWVFANKLWHAGRLPSDALAYLLWVPQLIATFWLLGATAWTLYSLREDEPRESKWEVTDTILRANQWVTRATGVAVLIVLVVVTVIQHQGIAQDKQAEQDWATSR